LPERSCVKGGLPQPFFANFPDTGNHISVRQAEILLPVFIFSACHKNAKLVFVTVGENEKGYVGFRLIHIFSHNPIKVHKTLKYQCFPVL